MMSDIIPSAFFDYEDERETELEVEFRVRVDDGRVILVSGLECDVDKAVAAMRENAALRAQLDAAREVIRGIAENARLDDVSQGAPFVVVDVEEWQAAAAWLTGQEGE